MREARSATLITATHEGLVGAMLPVVLDERRLHRHHLCALASSNLQWKLTPTGEPWRFSLRRRPISALPGT
ncbi:hypothetical protein [Bradyrhizobium sp. S3.2.12]|uniref:hypothetical protein n=1 Tax=Bradyrhizobium sp. S3.2.12 TaxID=3156387 RepID=UPI00339312BC